LKLGVLLGEVKLGVLLGEVKLVSSSLIEEKYDIAVYLS
jgi:hypothetical protein